MLRAVVFDWGDTVMRNLPGCGGPMAGWPVVEAVPGVEEALRALHPQYQLALATNARDSGSELVRAALRRAGLELFDCLFTARDLGATKPDPCFFRAVLTQLGCRPEEVVMVGDDYEVDVLGAKDAGWRAVWFNAAGAVCPNAQPRHDAEVMDMADLPSALERLCRPDMASCFGSEEEDPCESQ